MFPDHEDIKKAQEAWGTFVAPMEPVKQFIAIVDQAFIVVKGLVDLLKPPGVE